MSQMGDFFGMTKHERMGTIILLLVIALLTIGSFAVKGCSSDEIELSQSTEIQRFESETDSLKQVVVPKKDKKPYSASKKRQRRHDSKPKKTPPARPVDPVPQF